MSTSHQIQLIHIAKSQLALSDDEYRGMLRDWYGKSSSTQLTTKEAADLIAHFEKCGFKRISKNRSIRFNELRNRRGMASPEQLRKIEAMWADMCKSEDKPAALRKFLFRMVKTTDLRFLNRRHAHEMIEILKQIQKRKGISQTA
jgi:phage gp16-like protein